MYLSTLSNEKKHLFLELEIYMSKIDGNFSDEEKMIIDTHCIEMRIDNNNYECELQLDLILTRISNECDKQEKRIFFLELAATVIADNVYHDTEKELIERLAELMDINEDQINEVLTLIKNMKASYEGCVKFVKGE